MRTLHALGREQMLSFRDLAAVGEVSGSAEGQSHEGPGPVSLWRRNLSRC